MASIRLTALNSVTSKSLPLPNLNPGQALPTYGWGRCAVADRVGGQHEFFQFYSHRVSCERVVDSRVRSLAPAVWLPASRRCRAVGSRRLQLVPELSTVTKHVQRLHNLTSGYKHSTCIRTTIYILRRYQQELPGILSRPPKNLCGYARSARGKGMPYYLP